MMFASATSEFIGNFLVTFWSILFEALPFIVLGALVSGILEELLPQQFFARYLPKRRVLAIIASSLLGLILPMCECGIVAVMRRLLAKGVPASCAVTYMLSAPVINPIVLASTAMAFWGSADLFGVGGLGMVLARGGFAFITAVSIGLLFERLSRKGIPIVRSEPSRSRIILSSESIRLLEQDLGASAPSPASENENPASGHAHGHDHDHGHANCDHDHDHGSCEHDHGHPAHGEAGMAAKRPRSLLDRLTAISQITLTDFLDIAAFLVIGSALAALVNSVLHRDQMELVGEYRALSIVAMMTLSFVLSLCSEADAFVAANFVMLPFAAKAAFLVMGPMLDIKLIIMYRWVFTARAVATLVVGVTSIVFVLTYGWSWIETAWLTSFSMGDG